MTILQHPRSPVTFDPAPVREVFPDAPLRLHLAETEPDRRLAPDPVQRRLDMETVAMLADQCGPNELIAVLEIAEVYGTATTLLWLKNIAAIQGGL